MSNNGAPKRKRGRPSLSQTLDLNDILVAALKVFAEKGYDGAQLKDVAQAVGVTNPLINYRFENKADLWKKSISFLGDKLVARFENIKSYYIDLSGTMALRAYTRQYIYFLAENPSLYKIIFQEMGQDNWRSNYIIEQLFTPVIWFGEKSIEEPLDSLKEFKAIPRANFISIIMGASSGFFMLAHLMKSQYGTEVFSKEQIDQHAELVNQIIYKQFED
jgi:AcrR family transcriptional regulator